MQVEAVLQLQGPVGVCGRECRRREINEMKVGGGVVIRACELFGGTGTAGGPSLLIDQVTWIRATVIANHASVALSTQDVHPVNAEKHYQTHPRTWSNRNSGEGVHLRLHHHDAKVRIPTQINNSVTSGKLKTVQSQA